ncbi:ArsR/SmtB family transcription factor [Aquimarina mytili]|uniref:Helix-turn-helix transcriptional regulator n=1 Tax=Aquimarina mytili TaxID=874423 RepID=A0A937DD46_9FLAO|nr:metalloregulator ArsR/SmtB family transcription factor [Aquimarina mytili]MBL0685631.1 helix-turn-helix transcriptional regulator [Aquimarina mytili]
METRRDVFQAIADPTRREIISLLANQSMNLNTISENFDMSRQAVSLHIKILQECNLIAIKQQGRQRICEAKLDKLTEVHEWTEQFSIFWTKKLQALKQVVEASPIPTSETSKIITKSSLKNKKQK